MASGIRCAAPRSQTFNIQRSTSNGGHSTWAPSRPALSSHDAVRYRNMSLSCAPAPQRRSSCTPPPPAACSRLRSRRMRSRRMRSWIFLKSASVRFLPNAATIATARRRNRRAASRSTHAPLARVAVPEVKCSVLSAQSSVSKSASDGKNLSTEHSSDRRLYPREARRERPHARSARGQAHAAPPCDIRPHRPAAHAGGSGRLPRRANRRRPASRAARMRSPRQASSRSARAKRRVCVAHGERGLPTPRFVLPARHAACIMHAESRVQDARSVSGRDAGRCGLEARAPQSLSNHEQN